LFYIEGNVNPNWFHFNDILFLHYNCGLNFSTAVQFFLLNWPNNPGRAWQQSYSDSTVVLPGGRNSGQKAQKGPQEKKSWPKEFVAEFWLILPKSGRKGAKENFQKKFLIFSCDNHV
jgi:hypothetical protein